MNEKLNQYFRLLHPKLEELSDKEQWFAAGDEVFISENIDTIDRKFQEILGAKERRGEEIDKQIIMKTIISELKTKQITTKKIGQLTADAPIIVKQEVQQVEANGNTRDKEK